MTVENSYWVCAVKVATVWTEPASAREIDSPGTSNPVQLVEWLEALPYKERLALCNENRVQTQLLYGEPVIVDEIKGDWAKIIAVWQPSKKDERGYPGWVPLAQLKEIDEAENKGIVRVKSSKAQLWDIEEKPLLILPFNTILPVLAVTDDFYKVAAPHGEGLLRRENVQFAASKEHLPKLPLEEAIRLGEAYLDLPYLWGGMSPYGFDCSGFSYNMLKACGYFISRDASDQAREGIEVSMEEPSSWKRGDLLFFANDEGTGPVRHVGFYYGNGQLLHSPSTGKSVEILTLEGSKLQKEICAVRRYAV